MLLGSERERGRAKLGFRRDDLELHLVFRGSEWRNKTSRKFQSTGDCKWERKRKRERERGSQSEAK